MKDITATLKVLTPQWKSAHCFLHEEKYQLNDVLTDVVE